jgi:hypothetical protein
MPEYAFHIIVGCITENSKELVSMSSTKSVLFSVYSRTEWFHLLVVALQK